MKRDEKGKFVFLPRIFFRKISLDPERFIAVTILILFDIIMEYLCSIILVSVYVGKNIG